MLVSKKWSYSDGQQEVGRPRIRHTGPLWSRRIGTRIILETPSSSWNWNNQWCLPRVQASSPKYQLNRLAGSVCISRDLERMKTLGSAAELEPATRWLIGLQFSFCGKQNRGWHTLFGRKGISANAHNVPGKPFIVGDRQVSGTAGFRSGVNEALC
jgi:hypothetical protein